MTKKEVQQRVLQDGKPLDLDKFTWDDETKVFSSNEDNLVIDFIGVDDCKFVTGSDCTLATGSRCKFVTWGGCKFVTWSRCTFDTGGGCEFVTGSKCVVVRRDVYEVIELKKGVKTKLNGYVVKGYEVIEDEPK
jgi:hypothetical protein